MYKSVLAAAATMSICGSALAVDFSFSFTDTQSGQGTVTGAIYGLAASGSSNPTNVTASYDGQTYDFGDCCRSGSFEVTNGSITFAGYFTAKNFDGEGANPLTLYLSTTYAQLQGGPQNANVVAGNGSNISFAELAAAPEPESWAMMVGGFALVGGAMRRRSAARASMGFR